MSILGHTAGNLSRMVKITKIIDYTAANTTEITPAAGLDMEGFESVIFLVSIGTANAANVVYLQQDTASNMASAADLEDSQLDSDGTQDEFVIELYRPQERYVWPVVDRSGASTTIESAWAIQFGARKVPIDNETTTQAYALNIEPDEGTK